MHHAFLAALAIFTLSLNLVAVVLVWASSRQLDIPNERSSHTVPTPRGGGIAIVLSAFAGLWFLWHGGHVDDSLALALVGAGGLVALVGFLDDRLNLPALPRLIAQLAAACFAILVIGGVPPIPIGDAVLVPGLAGTIFAVIALGWLINLTNFMDGIDGLAGSHTLFVGAAGGALLIAAGEVGAGAFLILLGAAALGFLMFNWPPARIFMGDVSSGFIGLVTGTVAIATSDSVSLWAWGVLMTPFIADATVTRAMRFVLYKDLFGAHRAHVYQRLSRRWGGHQPVVLAFWALSLGGMLPLALKATHHPENGWLILGITWTAAFAAAFLLGAGRDDEENPSV